MIYEIVETKWLWSRTRWKVYELGPYGTVDRDWIATFRRIADAERFVKVMSVSTPKE